MTTPAAAAAEPATDERKKEVIGNYELGPKLGKGTFSSVRECTDKRTGKRYAMKILDKAQLAMQHMGEQVNREIAVLLKMNHQNVCGMRECFQTNDRVYLILDLVKGGELFDKIVKQKHFGEETAKKYFHQLIRGLHYCHKHGVAHRDLKPENLLLDDEDNLKISDFGLSNRQKTTDSGRVAPDMLLKTVCGTPNYVAPEVLREKGYNGFQADMWSCGVILYVMLTGKLPFHDTDMKSLFRKITTGSYTLPQNISPGAENLISHLLCVDQQKRYTIADIVQHPWFRVGWDDAWLDEGELVRTPSQMQINKAISSYAERAKTRDAEKEKQAADKRATPPPISTSPQPPTPSHAAQQQECSSSPPTPGTAGQPLPAKATRSRRTTLGEITPPTPSHAAGNGSSTPSHATPSHKQGNIHPEDAAQLENQIAQTKRDLEELERRWKEKKLAESTTGVTKVT